MKMFRVFPITYLFILFLTFSLSAQAPDTLWTRTYGDRYSNLGYSVQQTSDGGYIIAGTTTLYYTNNEKIYLVKINSQGDTLWTRFYGDVFRYYAYSVQQTSDNGYIIAGESSESSGKAFLLKINESGDSLWMKEYGSSWADAAYAVVQTSDNGYIVTGKSSPSGGNPRFFLLKTDSQGNLSWSKTYRSGHGCGYSVLQTSDGGYIVTGAVDEVINDYDIYLLRTNTQGDSLWAKTFGGIHCEESFSIQKTTEGGYILAGWTKSFGAGDFDVYLVKTDSNGDTLWTKTYGGTHREKGNSIHKTFDGCYIVTGWVLTSPDNDDVYLIKTDSLGNELWSKAWGGLWDDYGYSIEATTDGGYAIVGYTESFGAGNADVWLLKIESEDTIPPKIDSTTTWGNTSSPGPFPVYTKISDLLGIDTVLLYYKRLEDTQWMSTAMTEVKGTWYYGEIPSVSLPEDTVKYYIYSKDKAQPPNESTDPPGAPSNYYSFVANSAGIIEDGVTKAESTIKNVKISPNPFTHTVLIEGCSKAIICDISGRIIAEVKSNWNGKNSHGQPVPPGIYFLNADGKYVGKVVKVR